LVVLRLTRTGKKKQAFYRIVAADSRRFVNSKFIEILGWYNPKTKEVSLKAEQVNAWIAKGAQPSNTVAKLLKENGIKLPDWVVITEKSRKPKKEPVVKEPKVEAPAETEAVEAETPAEEEVAEAPAEEVAVEAPQEEAPAEEAIAEVDPSTNAQDDTEVSETTETE